MKRLIILAVALLIIPCSARAANRVHYETFNSYTGTNGVPYVVTQPSVGSAWVQYDVSSYPGDPYATNYTFASPGRNGTGKYLRGAANVSPFWTWRYNDTWPSNELYASFYEKFEGWVAGGYENFKIWRVNFLDGLGGYSTIEVIHTIGTSGISIVYYNANGVIRNSAYSNPKHSVNLLGGNWVHYEFYVNFTSKVLRMWIDGNYVYTNETQYPRGDSGWTITNHPYWLNAGNIDGSGPGTYTSRGIDDIEYWDGMPSKERYYNILIEPNAPTNLKIK